MRDKLMAGLWTFAVTLPLQALCCLGPVAVVPFVLNWIVGASYSTTILLLDLSIMGAAIVAYWAKGWRGARLTNTHAPALEPSGPLASQCCPVGPGRTEFLRPVVVKVWAHGGTGRIMMKLDPARAKNP